MEMKLEEKFFKQMMDKIMPLSALIPATEISCTCVFYWNRKKRSDGKSALQHCVSCTQGNFSMP